MAVGTLLIAGEAMGITVHDVLSNGFWSTDQRGTEEYLQEVNPHPVHTIKQRILKDTVDKEGNRRYATVFLSSGPKQNGVRWKKRLRLDRIKGEETTWYWNQEKEKLVSKRDGKCKEKTLTLTVTQRDASTNFLSEFAYNMQAMYKVKPLKGADGRPMGSFVVDDWFPDKLESSYMDCSFYGTEHNATTNIISDNEAYITRTIYQTGRVNETVMGYKVDEDASLLRTYNTHITTDADHVYVEQQIEENVQNDPLHNDQTTYQTQYTATFKKGSWKGATETISKVENSQPADWYIKYKTSSVSSVDNKVANGVKEGVKVAKVASHPTSNRTKDTQNHR